MLDLYGVLYIKEYYLRQCNRFNWSIHKIFEFRNEGGLSEAVKHRENGHDLWHDLYTQSSWSVSFRSVCYSRGSNLPMQIKYSLYGVTVLNWIC